MLFTGETERSIDEKQRISIPTEMRQAFASNLGTSIVYASPGPNASIWLWPEATFQTRANTIEQSLLQDEDEMDFEQVLFSQSCRLEIDKQGRIRLPETLLSLAGITRQAVILGVRDHLEVVDAQAWAPVRDENLSKLREIMVRVRKNRGRGA